MSARPNPDPERRVRSREGVWTFTEQDRFRFEGSTSGNAFLLVRTPEGELLDLYLPVGVDSRDLPGEELVVRARRVLERSSRLSEL